MRNLLVILLVAGIVCTLAVSTNAQEASPNPSILAVNNSLSLAYLSTNMYYTEPDDGQFLGTGYFDQENGNMQGGRIAVSVMGQNNIYFRIAYSGVEGQVGYSGFIGVQPANLTTRETMQEIDLRLGIGIGGKNWMLVPYLDGGRRHWLREIGLGTPGDFNESYDFGYIGLGNMIQYSPRDGWVLTGDASFGTTINPTINVPIVGLNYTALGQAPIVRLGIEGDCRIYKWVHIFIGGEYLHYSFNQSAVQASGFLEPASRTDLYSFTTGLRFAY